MYEAKAAGRARYAWYTPRMTRATTERLELEADLARALERDELFLQYQPIVRLGTGEVAGAEALLRWRHPVRGLVSPADFIPVAEVTGQIVPIGSWVLHEAARQAARWLARWPQLAIGVNVSGVQLADAGFAADVATAIETWKLAPRSLVLELTETVLMQDAEATIARLWEMRRLGAQIAVDDFGTGYSSLQYLLRFPLDIIKLARPFVDSIDGSEHEQAVGRAILELAAGLNLRVVGEGIERAGQRDRLTELGCQLGQGFHLARPLDPAAFEAFLSRGQAARRR
jgi:EAL domain-containing protein (putative c-di-GMP-specific phosphodiesterase class I)